MVLNHINFYDIPNFVLISVVAMLLLSLLFGLVFGRVLVAPLITLAALVIAAFMLPNFYDIKFQPLLGYAAFLTVISLLISLLCWYLTKNHRTERRLKRKANLEQRRFDETQNRAEMESFKHHENKLNR